MVDNHSTDRTIEVAEASGARVVHHGVRNITSVRNVGIREARYDLILSIDADCLTPPDAFQKNQIFMKDNQFIGAALGLRLQTDKLRTRILAGLFQFLIERLVGMQGSRTRIWHFGRQSAEEQCLW